MIDHLDAMLVLVTALNEGSLAAAGRQSNRSPAAVSRALAFLETHVGAKLLHRTTRSIRLTGVGESYAATCNRELDELAEADRYAAVERAFARFIAHRTEGGPCTVGCLVYSAPKYLVRHEPILIDAKSL